MWAADERVIDWPLMDWRVSAAVSVACECLQWTKLNVCELPCAVPS